MARWQSSLDASAWEYKRPGKALTRKYLCASFDGLQSHSKAVQTEPAVPEVPVML